MKIIVILLFLVILLYSCTRPPKDVRTILNVAGDNRPELERVIDHYKASGDVDKLKAAYFLIGNMKEKYALDGDNVRKYDPIFNVFNSFTSADIRLLHNSPTVNASWDSLVEHFGPPSPGNADVISDYSHIKADYLIENIDLSFKLKDNSTWGQKINFEKFCEFVLAYRFHHEPLEPWRIDFYNKYKALRDSANADSIYRLSRIIHNQVYRTLRFHAIFTEYPFDIPLDKMKVVRYGACPHIVVYSAMAMRSVGLPVAIDYVTKWANQPSGHTWNVLLLENDKFISYDGQDDAFNGVYFRKIAKVYRETFASQNIELPENIKDVPMSLLNEYRKDVTHEYTKVYNIPINLTYPSVSRKKSAIICTFDNTNWFPQDWGKIKKNVACFKNIGSDVVYIALYYDDGYLYTASDPFILSTEGKVFSLVSSKEETQNMLLVRKYPTFRNTQIHSRHMVKGNFQGANNPDFRDSVILYTITKSPEKIETALITNPLKFRYVRYRPPFKGIGEVAELEFYGGDRSSDTLKLAGKVIGFPEIPPSIGSPYQNAFDTNLETYFGRIEKGSSWAGLDLGSPKRIIKIKYCPRSDTNFILMGDTYELCFWDNGEWISMGPQVAKDQFLLYENVPSGGLYILHNLTRGKEERIFTYENGKQIFW